MPLGHHGHVLFACEDQPHGPAGGARQQRRLRAGRGGRVLLAAEPAARHRLHDARVVEVAAQRGGHRLLDVERALHGAVHHDARSLGQGHHPVGLDVGVLLVGRAIRPLDDHEARLAQRRLRLAAPDLPLRDHLALRERVFHVEQGRQRLVFHRDSAERGHERLAVLRGHQRDGLADVPDHAVGQHRPVALDHGDEVLARDVRRGQHGVDARQRPRGLDVEAPDARVGVRRAQHAGQERAGHGHVLDVQRAALHLVEGVRACDPLADCSIVQGGSHNAGPSGAPA